MSYTTTRLDIMFIVSLISRYMSKSTELYLQETKRTLRYLKGIVNYRIFYKRGEVEELLTYTDSDYVEDVEDMKSTFGHVFFYELNSCFMVFKEAAPGHIINH